jgi:hypothetical protein
MALFHCFSAKYFQPPFLSVLHASLVHLIFVETVAHRNSATAQAREMLNYMLSAPSGANSDPSTPQFSCIHGASYLLLQQTERLRSSEVFASTKRHVLLLAGKAGGYVRLGAERR